MPTTPAMYEHWSGLRNNVTADRLDPGDLVAATNVLLDDSGSLYRREGQTIKATDSSHSLWSNGDICLVVQGTDLKRLHSDYTLTTLQSGLTADKAVRYWESNSRIYWSNGVETGVIDGGLNRTWGIIPPVTQPTATATGGTMREGLYQFAITYLRADGQESGTGLAGIINLPSGGGIDFTLPVSDDPAVTRKIVYLTPPDGDMLYQALVVDNATTAASYTDYGTRLTRPLDTQFLQQAPAGHIVFNYRGRMYVANGSNIFYSDAFGPEWFNLRNWLPFNSHIEIAAPVEHGIYIATEKQTVFLRGNDPDEFVLEHICEYGGVEGTLAYTHADRMSNESGERKVAIWMSTKGICVGSANGSMQNVTSPRFQFNLTPQRGAGLLRTLGGTSHYVASLYF